MTIVRVTLPATAANIGPGYNSMALALGLYNTIELAELSYGFELTVSGQFPDQLPRDITNLVAKGAVAVFRTVGIAPSGLRIHIENNIPPGSGLGSSASALLGGVKAANVMLGNPLSQQEVLRIAINIEGHPNAICASLLGGLVLSSYDRNQLVYASVPVAPMRVVIIWPDIHLKNDPSILPQQVSLDDASFNIGRAGLVVQALARGDYTLLGQSLDDRLHQPIRGQLIPGFDAAVKAAKHAGASAATISGSGPAVIAFAPDNHQHIADAMTRAVQTTDGCEVQSWVLPIDTQGISISETGASITQRPIPASDVPVSTPERTAHSGE